MIGSTGAARRAVTRRPALAAERLESRVLFNCGCSSHEESLTPIQNEALQLAGPYTVDAGGGSGVSLDAIITPQASSSDSSNTTPTGWLWYHGVDSTFLSARVADGYRLVDLEVEDADPLRFSAAFVHNSGTYAKGWWWYFGLTSAQVTGFINANTGRLVDIESYVTGGQRRYAVIMISNTGADAKGWWWYFNVTPAQIETFRTANNARLVDIDEHTGGADRTFDVIMNSNTGADAAAWWYYYNATPAQISSALSTNQARLVDIEAVDSGHFDVIMERTPISGWWWYYGQTAADVSARVSQNGARLFHLAPYFVGGQKFFAVLMVNNSNEVESRVGEILRDASGTAETGLYLKRVGGPVLAGLQESFQFEPASMIKSLLNLAAMRQVQAGNATLNEPLWMYYDPADPYVSFANDGNPDECPDSYAETVNNRVSLTLQQTLERMMERSDNRATETIDDRFGRPFINATAAAAGMTNTEFASRLGCGVPGNFLTLVDSGRMFEGVLNNTLLSAANEATFFRMMTDDDDADRELVPFGEGVFGPFQTVVRQEAASLLGLPQANALVVALGDAFIAEMRGAWKGGGYTLSAGTDWNEVRTAGGYVGLPYRNTPGVTTVVNFVYGIYIEGALVPKNNPAPGRALIDAAWSNSQAELLRNEIRAALATWRVNPRISINNVSVAEGDAGNTNMSFTVSLSGGGSDLPVRVNYATQNGTAIAPGDYTTESGVINFPAGDNSQTLTIAVRGDTLDENNETFSVVLSSPLYATIQDGTGTGTINDDDDPPTVSVDDFRALEQSTGTTAFTFTVRLSAASSKTVAVTATTAPNTATAPSDYTHVTGPITFNPGETQKTFVVSVVGDTAVEPDETFFVNLSAPSNATIGDGQGTGTILNDDSPAAVPTVSAVYLSGTAWARVFMTYLQTIGAGNSTYGFAVPGAAAQLDEMPWVNVNQVSITFSEDVVVDAGDLAIRGLNVVNYSLDPAGFSYNNATRTATWRLAGGATFRNDKVLLDLDADAADGVRTAAGVYLDGNWANGADAFPSGDGAAGADFRFRVNFLPADVNRNGSVLANDASEVKTKFFSSTANPGAGAAAYSIYHDVNGSGNIIAGDFSEVKTRFFQSLPGGEPTLRTPFSGKRIAEEVL